MKSNLYGVITLILVMQTSSMLASATPDSPRQMNIRKLELHIQLIDQKIKEKTENPDHQQILKKAETLFAEIKSTENLDPDERQQKRLQSAHKFYTSLAYSSELGLIAVTQHLLTKSYTSQIDLYKAKFEKSEAENANLKAQLAALAPEPASK